MTYNPNRDLTRKQIDAIPPRDYRELMSSPIGEFACKGLSPDRVAEAEMGEELYNNLAVLLNGVEYPNNPSQLKALYMAQFLRRRPLVRFLSAQSTQE